MGRVSKSYILTFESENSYLAYPRDFEKMFKRIGYTQILYKFYNISPQKQVILPSCISKYTLSKAATLRIFAPN